MKRKDLLKDLRAQDGDSLKKKLLSLSEEIMKLRFRKATGQLQQSHLLKQMRRQVAVIKTIMKAKTETKSA